MQKNYWPIAIVGIILFGIVIISVGVMIAVKNPVVDEQMYGGKKRDIDEQINTILKEQREFESRAKATLHMGDEKIALETPENEENEEFDEEVLHMRQLLKTKLVDMDLSVRALNCLKSAEVETLGELVVFNKTDLLKFRNFGKKSLTELDELLANLNLSFGMDISKYKLDKE